jgi:ribonuclease Z
LAVSVGAASAQDIRVTLLGTGTPAPVMNRFGASNLVEAGEQKFLFDAGRGAMRRCSRGDRAASSRSARTSPARRQPSRI